MGEITYTASAAAVARELDRSEIWVRATAKRLDIGHREEGKRERRFLRADVARLRKLVDPEERRGRTREGAP